MQHLHFIESTPRSTPVLSELLRLLLQLLQPAAPPTHRGSSGEIKRCHYQLQFETVETEMSLTKACRQGNRGQECLVLTYLQ